MKQIRIYEDRASECTTAMLLYRCILMVHSSHLEILSHLRIERLLQQS